MKKLVIGFFAIIVMLVLTAFIFIPANLTVSLNSIMNANQTATYRVLGDNENWPGWWPGLLKFQDTVKTPVSFNYKGNNYKVTKKLFNALEIGITNSNQKLNSRIFILPVNKDSIALHWETIIVTSKNPIKRAFQYKQAVTMKKDMAAILDCLKAFVENTESVYKFKITHTTLKDTFLVSTKNTSSVYPTTKVIYDMINDLKKYIKASGAKETNYPILNISKSDSQHFTTMVAIATDKELKGNGKIALKRFMIYKDKILTTEVKGGTYKIQQAHNALNTYVNDYKLMTPVIHFEYLITDRSKESDTTKWVTKIYMPIA